MKETVGVKIRQFGMAVLVLVMLSPTPARAEGLFKLFLGTSNDDNGGRNSATYGLGLGALAGGIFGFEVDFGISPDFLGAGVENSNLVTIMGNLVLAVPLGVVRPYASSGVGLVRFSVTRSNALDIDSNDFGVNMGGGVEGFLTNNIGVIGDFRYFRSVEKDSAALDFSLGGRFNFWRVTAGVTFAF